MTRFYAKILSLALALTVTALGAGLSSLGTLSTSGTVLTNNQWEPSGSTLREGDRLQTYQDALAMVHSPSIGRFEVRSDSDVTFQPGAAALARGAAASNHLPVRLGNAIVRPAKPGGDTWFVVAARGGQKVVAAYRGDVVVEQAGFAPFVVRAGTLAMAAGPERAKTRKTRGAEPAAKTDGKSDNPQSGTAEKEEDCDDKKEKKDDEDDDCSSAAALILAGGAAAGGAAGAATTGGWTIGTLSHAASVAVVGSIGAAGIAATVAGVTLTDEPASPAGQ